MCGLVVDDNEDIRTSTLELLRIVGCVVATAEDGPGGIDAVARFAPDVALIDIGMPGMSGYEVARRVRALPGTESLTLIAVTGFGQEDDRAKAREAGFSAHLVKPIGPGQLASAVERSRQARPRRSRGPIRVRTGLSRRLADRRWAVRRTAPQRLDQLVRGRRKESRLTGEHHSHPIDGGFVRLKVSRWTALRTTASGSHNSSASAAELFSPALATTSGILHLRSVS